DEDLDRGILHRAVKGGVEVVGHLQVLRVPRLGPVHQDARDARRRPFHDDGLVCRHGLLFPRVLTMLTISANDRQEPSAAKWLRHSGMRCQDPESRGYLGKILGSRWRAPRNDDVKFLRSSTSF